MSRPLTAALLVIMMLQPSALLVLAVALVVIL